MDEWFYITPARLGLRDAQAPVPVGWKEICAVVKIFLSIGIQMRLPCLNLPDTIRTRNHLTCIVQFHIHFKK
jgi:hypothetical protein